MMSTRTSNFPALYSLDAHARVHTQPRDNKNDRSNKVFIGLLIFVAAAATKRTRFAFETIPTIPLIIVPFAPVSLHEGLMLFIPKSVKKKKKKKGWHTNATVLTNTSTHTPPTSIHGVLLYAMD